LHEGTPLRTLRFADQPQAGFLGSAIGLFRVARNARANDVFPGGRTPRSRGRTWSKFRSFLSNAWPQYWQVFLSRSKMLCRVNLTSFFGSRSNTTRRITRGTRIRKETVRTLSG